MAPALFLFLLLIFLLLLCGTPALFLFLLLLFLLFLCGTCTISLPTPFVPSPSMWHQHYFSSFCYYSLSFYVTPALFLFLLLLFLLLVSGIWTNSFLSAFVPSPSMWHLHYFSSFPYYSFSLYVAPALFLFLLLLFLLLLCGNCTISFPSAIIPSPSIWHLHYFSSFCYYSFLPFLFLPSMHFLLY